MESISTANPTSTNTSANRRNQSTVKLLQNKAIEVSLSPEKGKKQTQRKTFSSIYGQSSRRNPKKKLDETLDKVQSETSKQRPKSASRSLSKQRKANLLKASYNSTPQRRIQKNEKIYSKTAIRSKNVTTHEK